MDFYYAMTNYHLLCCILHKMLDNNNPARLYISSYLVDNQPTIIDNLKEANIFNEVYEFKEISFTHTDKLMNDKELNLELDRVCKEVEKVIGKELKESKNIYLCSDFYSIGFYLITNKIKYNYFEDGCGTISKRDLPFRIIEKENPNRAALVNKLNALGENEYVVNRYASLKDQIDNYYNEIDINFSVKEKLEKLKDKDINKILKIYNVKKIKIEEKNKVNLLLTMHYNQIVTENNQKRIYSNLLDYFTKKNEQIIVKPHPADTLKNYNKIFDNVKELNRYMPAELFPYCINKKFEKGITCWSTAIFGLKNIIKNIISFDTRIDTTYNDFDKYYAIISYLKEIKEDKIINIKTIDINEIQFINMLKYHFKDYKKYYNITEKEDNNTIYIVDKLNDSLNKKKVIVLNTNYKTDGMLYLKEIFNDNEIINTIGINNLKEIELNINYEKNYSKSKLNIKYINKKDYLDVMEHIINNSNKEIELLEKEISEKNSIIRVRDESIYFLNKKISSLQETINNIYSSKSWKLTKPIRVIIDKLRNIK